MDPRQPGEASNNVNEDVSLSITVPESEPESLIKEDKGLASIPILKSRSMSRERQPSLPMAQTPRAETAATPRATKKRNQLTSRSAYSFPSIKKTKRSSIILEKKPVSVITDPAVIAAAGFAPLPAHIEGTSAANLIDLKKWDRGLTKTSQIICKNPDGEGINIYEYKEHVTRPVTNLTQSQITTLTGVFKEKLENGYSEGEYEMFKERKQKHEEEKNLTFQQLDKEIIAVKKNSSDMFVLDSNKQNPNNEMGDFVYAIIPVLSTTGEFELRAFINSTNHIFCAGMMPYVVAAGDGFLIDNPENPSDKKIELNERTGAYHRIPTYAQSYVCEDKKEINYDDSAKRAVEKCFGKNVVWHPGITTPKDKHPKAQEIIPLPSGIVQRNMYQEAQCRKQAQEASTQIASDISEITSPRITKQT